MDMNKTKNLKSLQTVVLILFLGILACSQTQVATPTPIATATLMPTKIPTNTVTPIPANTNTPEPTPIPGVQVYPVSSLGKSNPWLPLDTNERPMSVYYWFNIQKPPFNNVLVRQAFAAAVDKTQIAQEATGFKFRNVTPATSITPPQVLGRDLYGDVGILFDPAKAKDLLQQAGYTSVESFPSVTLIVNTRGETSPGAHFRIANTVAGMWETYLGIKVNVEAIGDLGAYRSRLRTDPPSIFLIGWGAEYNDPDNFLKPTFHSKGEFNFGHFNNQEFDRLIDKAASLNDPAERQLLYIEAEKILTEQETGVIPLFHTLFYELP
jgi:ABC-type oligopeptide transport system substrate-binding subunit